MWHCMKEAGWRPGALRTQRLGWAVSGADGLTGLEGRGWGHVDTKEGGRGCSGPGEMGPCVVRGSRGLSLGDAVGRRASLP